MKRTKEESLITREQLIDCALAVFLKKGYSSTSISDIVSEAGYTRGAYYWHFKSKEELLAQMLEREHVFISKLITDLLDADLSPIVKIEHLVEGIINNFYDNKRFRNFIEFTWFKIEQNFNHKSIIYKASLNDVLGEKISNYIEEAIQLKQVNSFNTPKEVSLHLLALINGVYRLYFISPNQLNQKDDSIKLFKNYINLIKN